MKLNYCLAAAKLGLTPGDATFLYALGRHPNTINQVFLDYLKKEASEGCKVVAKIIRHEKVDLGANKEYVYFMANWLTKNGEDMVHHYREYDEKEKEYVYVDNSEQVRDLENELDKVTYLLAEIGKARSENLVVCGWTKEHDIWWNIYRQKNEERQNKIRHQALSKLTDEEKKVLGIK